MKLLARLRRPEGPADESVLMPDWIIARIAAIYAAVGGAVMAQGGQTLCDAGRIDRGTDAAWCSLFMRDEQWIVLIAGPAVLAMMVVLLLPRGRDRRFRAWCLIALAEVLFVCVGPAL